jgi:hypothetical protein
MAGNKLPFCDTGCSAVDTELIGNKGYLLSDGFGHLARIVSSRCTVK